MLVRLLRSSFVSLMLCMLEKHKQQGKIFLKILMFAKLSQLFINFTDLNYRLQQLRVLGSELTSVPDNQTLENHFILFVKYAGPAEGQEVNLEFPSLQVIARHLALDSQHEEGLIIQEVEVYGYGKT